VSKAMRLQHIVHILPRPKHSAASLDRSAEAGGEGPLEASLRRALTEAFGQWLFNEQAVAAEIDTIVDKTMTLFVEPRSMAESDAALAKACLAVAHLLVDTCREHGRDPFVLVAVLGRVRLLVLEALEAFEDERRMFLLFVLEVVTCALVEALQTDRIERLSRASGMRPTLIENMIRRVK